MRGVIQEIQPRGGLLKLTIKDCRSKRTKVVYGDNGPTVRALDAIFGDVITRAHAFRADKVLGQEVGYGLGDFNLLEYLTK